MGKIEITTASKKFYRCDGCKNEVSLNLAKCEVCNNKLSEVSKSIWKDTISSTFYKDMNLSVERIKRIKTIALWIMLFGGLNAFWGLFILNNSSFEFSSAYSKQTLYVGIGFSLLTALIAYSIREKIYSAKEKLDMLLAMFGLAFLFAHGGYLFNKFIIAIPLFYLVKERYRIYKNGELKSQKDLSTKEPLL